MWSQSVNKVLRFCSWYGFWNLINFGQNVSDSWFFAWLFHPYFMEIITLISFLLQLSHNGSLKLLKIFITSVSQAIWSYNYGIFHKIEISIFSQSASFYWALWSQKRWRGYVKWKMRHKSHFVTFLTPFWEVRKIDLALIPTFLEQLQFWSWNF